MSDIYVPGVRSRFNSEQTIEDLMKLERVPRDRVQSNIETLQLQRGYWQEIGRRITSVRDSARLLYSFQNPFNERIAQSGNDAAITASTTREAAEQSYTFTVKQTAQADRFLSQPLDERMRVEAGTYTFKVGNDEISINYRGGTLRDFADVINRRGRDKISASLMAVQSGTRSLLIESKITGADTRLSFADDAVDFVKQIGMMGQAADSQRAVSINENTVRKGGQNANYVSINDGIMKVAPQSSATLPLGISVSADSPLILKLETQTRVDDSGGFNIIPQPPPGPSVPSSSVTYGGITVENKPSSAPLPEWTPPAAVQRQDDMEVISLVFSDGSSAKLSAITDSDNFTSRQYFLGSIAQGRTIASINIDNKNTHREVSVGKIEIVDPAITDGLRPLNAVSTARDAVITMEGIEIKRPTNNIDDLIPGVTLNVRGVSERPVDLNIKADVDSIKEAVIGFVGNYNRLMAEINVLTRRDDNIVNELTYLSSDEASEMKKRLGVFSGDTTLTTLRSNLLRIVSAPYPTDLERDLTLLAQIGISTNASRNTGYDPSRLRGYLEIDEKALDAALETKVPAIRQLFANDTTGDLLVDTGVAYNMDSLVRPFVEIGGIVSLKTSTIDSRITQDERRVATYDRQLQSKEAELRMQYARMEAAYARMEQMSSSLDNFSQQNSNNNR
uniref:Flagellar hook-associated protein 2 n=1 Tax=uncultured bacterium contig00060 TaxID=1181543 RepID=A0A806KME3_9BACT|nr:flagellar hook-associated protein FliD [uncultured bacterium contig00060]